MRQTLQMAPRINIAILAIALCAGASAQDVPPHDFWWAHGVDLDSQAEPEDLKGDVVRAVDFTAAGDVVYAGWSKFESECATEEDIMVAFIGGERQDGSAWFFDTEFVGDIPVLDDFGHAVRPMDVAIWMDTSTSTEYVFIVGSADIGWDDGMGDFGGAVIGWIAKYDLDTQSIVDTERIQSGRTPVGEGDCPAIAGRLSYANVEALGVDVSDDGEVIVTGWFETTSENDGFRIDFGPAGFRESQDGTRDIFILHLDADDLDKDDWIAATFPAATSSATKGHDQGWDVVFDNEGRFAVTGEYASGDLDFGTVELENGTTVTRDFFLAAYDLNVFGGFIFLDAVGSEGDNIVESGQGVATSTIGGVVSYYVGGYFSGTIFSNLDAMQSAGDFDMLAVAYVWDDTNDMFDGPIWYIQEGATGDDEAYGIAFTCDEEVQIAGQFDRSGDLNVFVGSYDPADGSEIWTEEVTAALGDDMAWDIAAGPIGDSAVVGEVGDDILFEDYAGTSDDLAILVDDGPDGFVSRIVNSDVIDTVSIVQGSITPPLDDDAFRLEDDVREMVTGGTNFETIVDVIFQLHPDCRPDEISHFRVMVDSQCQEDTVDRTVQVRNHAGGGSWVTLDTSSVGSSDVLSIATFDTTTGIVPVDASDQVTIRIIHEDAPAFHARHDWVRLETLLH